MKKTLTYKQRLALLVNAAVSSMEANVSFNKLYNNRRNNEQGDGAWSRY